MAQPGPGLYPLLVGGLLVLSALGVGVEATRGRSQRTAEWPEGAARARVSAVAGATLGYIMLLPYVGHLLAAVLVTLVVLQVMGDGTTASDRAPLQTPEDYRPVIKTGGHPVVFCVRADARWRTMAELLEQVRASPGAVRVGSAGVGTIPHIDLEALKEKAGVSLTHVPFAGAGEYISALLGGHIEAVVGLPVEVIPHVRANRMRALAIFSTKRNPLGVPIFPELGYDITAGVYHFVVAPKATPDWVVQIIHDALKKAIESDTFKKFADEQLRH